MLERQSSGLPASLVNGRLEGLSVPDLLWKLCRNRSTGVLNVTSREITKKVYIHEGRIVFALSGDPDDRLGDMLLREGLITLDQFEEAFQKLSTGKRLGTLLVDAGHLSPENLVRGVLSQVKGIVLGLFPLEEGEYAFVEGPLPTAEVITLGMRTAEILLQGIRQIRSFTRIRRSVGPPGTRFRLASSWRAILENLDIRDGERVLLQRLDDSGMRGVPIDALCREVFLSNFEIYQALWAFLILGVVEEVVRTNEGPKERSSLPELLVRLCREEATGVLYMSHGTLERSLHIKEGACVFATSNSIDDGLLAHLLRRGVISLSDREETARRLLSNKRVGTILLEMGVIDESDLLATVREQLSEIIFDTFRWEQGDFRFQPGALPTIEEITLNRSIEDLVFAGVRRVTSWGRVREGCGGLSARLVLQPKYLSVLDKMNVGPEEWELISLLKSPKSVLEICRESMLGDFRSCQILWALRILGGVGEAPIEIAVDTAIGIFDAPAARPDAAQPVALEPERDPEPLPVSEADTSAEVISEPWRLAALRPTEVEQANKTEPEPVPEQTRNRKQAKERKQAREREREQEQAREREREQEQEQARELEQARERERELEQARGRERELEEARTRERELEEARTRERELEEARTRERELEEARTRERELEEARARERELEEARTRERELEEARTRERELEEARTRERELEEARTRERELEEARTRERELEEARAREQEEARARERELAREPESAPAMIQIDSPADATIAVSREDVEAAIHAKHDGLPRFEIGEPGTGVEDMKIDMPPAAELSAAPPSHDRTVRVNREELEAALTPTSPPETSAPIPADEPPFVPQAGLDGVIASFNARHVILFRALRAEIGAGAANFVKSCRAGLDDGVFALFATAELRTDGSWDPEGLRHSVVAHRIVDAGVAFEKLLEGEIKRLRAHLGESRAAALANQLASIPLQRR